MTQMPAANASWFNFTAQSGDFGVYAFSGFEEACKPRVGGRRKHPRAARENRRVETPSGNVRKHRVRLYRDSAAPDYPAGISDGRGQHVGPRPAENVRRRERFDFLSVVKEYYENFFHRLSFRLGRPPDRMKPTASSQYFGLSGSP